MSKYYDPTVLQSFIETKTGQKVLLLLEKIEEVGYMPESIQAQVIELNIAIDSAQTALYSFSRKKKSDRDKPKRSNTVFCKKAWEKIIKERWDLTIQTIIENQGFNLKELSLLLKISVGGLKHRLVEIQKAYPNNLIFKRKENKDREIRGYLYYWEK